MVMMRLQQDHIFWTCLLFFLALLLLCFSMCISDHITVIKQLPCINPQPSQQDMIREFQGQGEMWRRALRSRPGSSPPRCISKCGKCSPCKPVHVPVPPGTPTLQEYYPEAWRCKCGNRLYMP